MVLMGLILAVNFGLPIEFVSLGIDAFALAFSYESFRNETGGDLMARTKEVVIFGAVGVY